MINVWTSFSKVPIKHNEGIFLQDKISGFRYLCTQFFMAEKIYTPFICEYNELILMPLYEIFEVKLSICIITLRRR